jgi:NDP-sugar pyrophosphorylase family protein
MLIEHQGKRPAIDPSAHIAPTAVICGDVTIGPRTHVSYGAVIEAHGAPVRIGAQCVIRENLNIRSTSRNAVEIGDQLFPPDKHEEIDAILSQMNFPEEVYGLERQSGDGVDIDMKELTRRVTSGLADHRDDQAL